ncbi:hypothetical protein LINPERPRIM_LOCUS2314 [Linum perenne]
MPNATGCAIKYRPSRAFIPQTPSPIFIHVPSASSSLDQMEIGNVPNIRPNILSCRA